MGWTLPAGPADRTRPVGRRVLGAGSRPGRPAVPRAQLTQTDHGHLGQILTYAAGTEAKTVVWMATSFREEHRQALDFLNDLAAGEARFFGVEIGVVWIGDSEPAPLFRLRARLPPRLRTRPRTRNRTFHSRGVTLVSARAACTGGGLAREAGGLATVRGAQVRRAQGRRSVDDQFAKGRLVRPVPVACDVEAVGVVDTFAPSNFDEGARRGIDRAGPSPVLPRPRGADRAVLHLMNVTSRQGI